ncbi:MAG: RNA polymerase sigma factor [Planctomycetaceae bacterium]
MEFETDLRAFLMGVLRDGHQVDDAFQRTVMRALEAAADVRPATLRGWLFRIALNEARGLKRTDRQQSRLQRAVWDTLSATEQMDAADGLAHAVSAEDRHRVQQALSRLQDNYQEVVIRRIQQDQTFAVIAEQMNKPLGTVLTWMRRALAELRNMPELQQSTDQASHQIESKSGESMECRDE